MAVLLAEAMLNGPSLALFVLYSVNMRSAPPFPCVGIKKRVRKPDANYQLVCQLI